MNVKPEVQELLNAVTLLEQGAANLIDLSTQARREYHVQVQTAANLLRKAVAPKDESLKPTD